MSQWSLADLCDEPTQWASQCVQETKGVLMDFVVDEVSLPAGGTVVRNYLRHPNSVGIIAVDDHSRVAVLKQYRHPVRAILLEAPAGLVDPGEDLLTTAQRELVEELGLSAESWVVLVDAYASPGCSTQLTRIFLARELTVIDRPEGFCLEGEEAEMEIGWAEVDHLLEAISAGHIRNPTLVMGILALSDAQRGNYLDALRSP
ncbi:MAG: NUDIX hydrolase [Propionibacteriaceae bacterium]|nr:NUDIX hydrolase [Propionibacteriaceae bacterium]